MGMSQHRRILAPVVALGIVGIALAGCTGGGGGDEGGGDGGEVSILGGFTDAQAEAFQADLDKWSETSGITVRYDGNTDFQTAVIARATAGNPPDIAIYPQPGVLKSQTSSLYPLEDIGVDVSAITSDEAEGLAKIAEVDGKTYGLPYSINVKSLVWYNPAAFEAAGLTAAPCRLTRPASSALPMASSRGPRAARRWITSSARSSRRRIKAVR